MGKLIELLNEFLKKEDKSIYTFYWNQVFNCIHRGNGERCDKEWIISKKFGFIKWLVENDKIDFDKCGFKNEGLSGNWYDKGIAFVSNYDNDTFKISEFYSPYLQLLMLLSISDTPIEDLVSYLR